MLETVYICVFCFSFSTAFEAVSFEEKKDPFLDLLYLQTFWSKEYFLEVLFL